MKAKKMEIKKKGKKFGICKRSACNNISTVYWFNRVTNGYYCQPCAFRINKSGLDNICSRDLTDDELKTLKRV